MTLKRIVKEETIAALINYRKKFDGTDGEFAKMFDMSGSVFSRMKKGEVDGLISDDKLVTIARKLGVQIKHGVKWNMVQTETYEFMVEMLENCRTRSVGRIFCDVSDLGKTAIAKQYMLQNSNVFYVDCSQVKDRRQFIFKIAKVLGLSLNKSMSELFIEITLMLQGLERPLLILDEGGDLKDNAFLEIKALCNALGVGQVEGGVCGICLMGASGLKAKLERGVRCLKIGWEETITRLGGEIYRHSPTDSAEFSQFMRRHAEAILHANMPGANLADVMPGKISLRRLQENVIKLKNEMAA
jgi:hypothetical protein